MKFAIVGAGALGTILGAHLLQAGHDVTLIARGKRKRQIEEQGLRLCGLTEMSMPCPVLEDSVPTGHLDALVFAVKTYHMQAALRSASHALPSTTFSLANGVQKHEQLIQVFGAQRVIGCMANFSGELHGDGRVSFTRNVRLDLGNQTEHSPAIAAAINACGIHTACVDNIDSIEWSKFVGWVVLFALAVITRADTGAFLHDEYVSRAAVAAVRECAALADARGIELIDMSPLPVKSIATLPFDAAAAKVRETGAEFMRIAPGHRMSSLQDVTAGRQLEVHETLGWAVRECEDRGLPVPMLHQLYLLSAGIDELSRRA